MAAAPYIAVAMAVVGGMQQAKAAKKQASAQRQQTEMMNKAEAAKNRYNQLLAKRRKITTMRQARIRAGKIVAATGGSGIAGGGTSSFTGSVGSIFTQASANVGNQNVATDTGNQVSSFNQQAANFGSDANTQAARGMRWQAVSSIGSSLFSASGGFNSSPPTE
jgi:hypothetical protein